MYYRRKILLALIEAFDGSLKRTDCEKLLFKFCQITGKNYYEFFPYQYGPFSYMSYFDKRRLTEIGQLKPIDDFQLNTEYSYFDELKPSDKMALLNLRKIVGNVRGNQLIKMIYQEYPHFAVKSRIVNDLFSTEERNQLQFIWNRETANTIFTTGYEGITIDGFLYRLISNNIDVVIDVRHNPHSMKYGFSKKSFQLYINNAGMKYIHLPDLGIPSSMRKELGSSVTHHELFQIYEDELLPKSERAQEELLSLFSKYSRVVLVCFEANHQHCHRNILIEYLKKKKNLPSPIVHL